MEVIHDWPDKEAIAILQAIRQPAVPGATLFLIELVVPPGAEPDWSKMLDIHMLTLLGGKQCTNGEYKALLEEANFTFRDRHGRRRFDNRGGGEGALTRLGVGTKPWQILILT
jgi:hypothetical protein